MMTPDYNCHACHYLTSGNFSISLSVLNTSIYWNLRSQLQSVENFFKILKLIEFFVTPLLILTMSGYSV